VDKFALSIFVKIRISNSNLNIERGRYIKLPGEKRICPLRNIEPEDEIHFILKSSLNNIFFQWLIYLSSSLIDKECNNLDLENVP
jgi:hypothetical protein